MQKSFLTLLGFALILNACSSFTPPNQENTPYTSQTGNNNTLLLPPGLSDSNLIINKNNDLTDQNSYIIDKITNMNIVQNGSERYLLIKNTKVNDLWETLFYYLSQEGLSIKYSNKNIGIIQTNWAVKNDIVPETGIRRLFQYIKLGDYSLPSKYMFRINVWQNGNDIEMFATHFTVTETFPNGRFRGRGSDVDASNPKWLYTQSNPQLDLDFLLRFMAYAGDKTPQPVINNNISNDSQIAVNNNSIIINTNKHSKDLCTSVAIALERVYLGIASKTINSTNCIYNVYNFNKDLSPEGSNIIKRVFSKNKNSPQDLKDNYSPEATYQLTVNAVAGSIVIAMQGDSNNKLTEKEQTDFINKTLKNLAVQLS